MVNFPHPKLLLNLKGHRDLRHQIEGAISPDPFNTGPARERTNLVHPTNSTTAATYYDDRQRRPQEVWNPSLPGPSPVNRNYINPWFQPTDTRTDHDTAHHSRNFIESHHTSRDEGTMTDNETTNREKEAKPYDPSGGQNK